MSLQLPRGMTDALRLTRRGRLGEATAHLQRLLSGKPEPADGRQADPSPGRASGQAPTAEARQAGERRAQDHAQTRTEPRGQSHPEASREPRPDPRPDRRSSLRTGLAETLRRMGADRKPPRQAERARPALPDGARFDTFTHSAAEGARDYKLYVPANLPAGRVPLVVMLHGCTQSPDDFAVGTRMNRLAEERGVLVAYPAQPAAANAQRCWNWFQPEHQGRGGEPALIAGIVEAIRATHQVDGGRIFVAGLSAGGAAAAVLGAAYPELFAAVGVHSGLPVGAARDVPSAFAAMRRASPVAPGLAAVPTIVFHGDADSTVDPGNAVEVVAQAAAGNRVEEQRGTAGGRPYTRAVHRDARGRVVAENWTVHGGGHAWSGGDPAGSYADPQGPDASAEMLRFFLDRHR